MTPCPPASVGVTNVTHTGHTGTHTVTTIESKTMSDTAEMQALPTSELTIVPCPQRESWAVVNRQGDILAIGGYGECLRRMGRLTAPQA
jgi:hypothetical protein